MQNVSVNLSVNQVYRLKRKAKDLINRDEQLQYGFLRNYAQMITTTDVGSRVILHTEIDDENSQSKFKRIYVRYNAQDVGFLGGCRPFIGLDGCHLKGRFRYKALFNPPKTKTNRPFLEILLKSFPIIAFLLGKKTWTLASSSSSFFLFFYLFIYFFFNEINYRQTRPLLIGKERARNMKIRVVNFILAVNVIE